MQNEILSTTNRELPFFCQVQSITSRIMISLFLLKSNTCLFTFGFLVFNGPRCGIGHGKELWLFRFPSENRRASACCDRWELEELMFFFVSEWRASLIHSWVKQHATTTTTTTATTTTTTKTVQMIWMMNKSWFLQHNMIIVLLLDSYDDEEPQWCVLEIQHGLDNEHPAGPALNN